MNPYAKAWLKSAVWCMSLAATIALAQEPAVAPAAVPAAASVPAPSGEAMRAAEPVTTVVDAPEPGPVPLSPTTSPTTSDTAAPNPAAVAPAPPKPRRIVKPVAATHPAALPATPAASGSAAAAESSPTAGGATSSNAAAADPAGSRTTPQTVPAVPAIAAARNVAGKINLVDGVAHVYAPDRSGRVPKIGDSLYEGDSVVTGANAELHVDMADGGFIAVRPNTTIRFTKYQANGDSDDRSVIGLLKGSLRSITGWIGKTYPEHYAIKTPGATIGVRGTDHEPAYFPEATDGVEAGTYDNVHAGGTTMTTVTGKVDVTPERAGFVGAGSREAPRLLDSVPAFFGAPRRNDGVFAGKHDQIVASLESKRTQRQAQHQQEVFARAARINANSNREGTGLRSDSGERRSLDHRGLGGRVGSLSPSRGNAERPEAAKPESEEHQSSKEESRPRRRAPVRHPKERQ